MAEKVLCAPRILAILLQEIWGTIWGAFVAFALPIALGVCSGGSRILKGGGSSVFDCAHARARGQQRMRAKRRKGRFCRTQGTPLDPPLVWSVLWLPFEHCYVVPLWCDVSCMHGCVLVLPYIAIPM